jgi:hypothetical protein
MNKSLPVQELPISEQVLMRVTEAGLRYDGKFIFFTNTEDKLENDRIETYAIPRAIALSQTDFYDSQISKRYRDVSKYGELLHCWVYLPESQMPPTLSF